MRIATSYSFLTAAVLLSSSVFAQSLSEESLPPPEQSSTVEAERLAAEAYGSYEAGDYAQAVALYLKAYSVSPSAAALYNIARIYDTKLKDRELAATFYRRYIADPQADPELVRKANERLTAIRELEVALAETEAPSASAAPEDVADAPESPGPSSARTVEEEQDSPALTGTEVTGLVLGGVGLVGLGVGAVAGLAAMADADDANAVCTGNRCRTQEGVDSAKDASTRASIATVGFVSGGVLLATGLVLLFKGRNSTKERAPSERASLSVLPAVSTKTLALSFQGTF